MRPRVLGPTLAALSGLFCLALVGCGRTPLPSLTAHEAAEDTPAEETTRTEPPAPVAQAPRLKLPCFADDPIGCTNACNDGTTEDCVTLGVMYLDGSVVRVDHARAIDLFRGACTNGSARGCMKLGALYQDGTLPVDLIEAVSLYRKACDAGANQGCVVAGKAYLDGKGVGADPVFAASLFARVCERGNAEACVQLGHLYDRGDGVRKDPSRATALFVKACQLGNDEGCLIASRAGEVLPPRN